MFNVSLPDASSDSQRCDFFGSKTQHLRAENSAPLWGHWHRLMPWLMPWSAMATAIAVDHSLRLLELWQFTPRLKVYLDFFIDNHLVFP